jgi:tripartite-type tricarboxylate transporter receptor subunit TctC
MAFLSKAISAACLVSGCLIAASVPAAAGTPWPTKPVRLIVPFSPGGGTDILARLIGQKLSATFGQQFIVDNRPGAGGTLGAEIAARATPDGHTIIIVSASYGANPALYKLPYDPVKGIAPISLIAVGPLIAVIHPSVKAATLQELIALARGKPDSINYGSTGVGSLAHLAGALLTQMTDTRMVHVPYKGAGPGLVDLVAGNIQLGFYTAVAVVPHVKSGKLRALAVTTEKRVDALPGVPAIGETVPGYAAEHWYGMWAPHGTPGEIIVRLNQELGTILQTPELRDRITGDGFSPAHTTPAEFGDRIARDAARWQEVVRRGNIRLDVVR